MQKPSRTFLFSLSLSLSVLLAAAGLARADRACRRLSFGEDIPLLQTVSLPEDRTALRIRVFSLDSQVDITELDHFFNFLLDFSCIPHN